MWTDKSLQRRDFAFPVLWHQKGVACQPLWGVWAAMFCCLSCSGGVWDVVVINGFQLKPFGWSVLHICTFGWNYPTTVCTVSGKAMLGGQNLPAAKSCSMWDLDPRLLGCCFSIVCLHHNCWISSAQVHPSPSQLFSEESSVLPCLSPWTSALQPQTSEPHKFIFSITCLDSKWSFPLRICWHNPGILPNLRKYH